MSFLDGILASSPDDPRYGANMALFGGMMRGDFAGGAQAYAHALQQGRAQQLQQQIAQQQLQRGQIELSRARKDEAQSDQMLDAARQSFRTPEQAASMSVGPTPDGGTVDYKPGFDSKLFMERMYGINPLKAMEIQSKLGKETPFSKVDPKDYTAASVMKFAQTNNYADLVPVRKKEVVNNRAVDLYAAEPGEVMDSADANKPFNIVGGQVVPNAAFQQYEKSKAKAGAASVSVNTGQSGLNNELKIRGDFRSEPIYKAHQEVQSAYGQIRASLQQASPAGDLAGATKLMKILDPGSVVRESELGMAMAASGAMDRLSHYASNIINGTKLTPTQRADFQNLADQLYQESAKQYNAKRGEYAGFATDYGLNADRIVGPAITSPKVPPTRPGAAPAPAGARFLGFE